MDATDIASALAAATREIDAGRDLSSVLETIVTVARDSIDGIDAAGISLMRRGGRMETMACTGELVLELDRLQYELGEGPCVDAMLADAPAIVKVNNIRHDQRWPRYVPSAVELGLTAQMGVRLFTDERVHGGLNLYATSAEVIDETAEIMAELFAVHAAVVLGRARMEEDLNAAIESRQMIGEAVGIVRERHGISRDQAVAYLIRISQTSNTKLRDVAAHVADGVAGQQL